MVAEKLRTQVRRFFTAFFWASVAVCPHITDVKRMKESFRQCMAWLHTWTGLITGWVLFFVFVTGTASYVDDEITRWMQPELPLASKVERSDDARMIGLAMARLDAVASGAKSWTITLPHYSFSARAERGLSVAWEEMPMRANLSGKRGNENLNIVNGAFKHEVEPRATGGGATLYRMHYALQYMSRSTGLKLVGICTMLMLLAVISGIITHKKIFTDFFTFRPGKGQRSWMDAHNVVSVMSLPFFLMITYTGLIFSATTYLPAARDVIYGDLPPRAFSAELREQGGKFLPVTSPRISLPDLVARVEADWGKGQVASLQLIHPEGEPPYIDVRHVDVTGVNYYDPDVARFSALDGQPLPYKERNATVQTQSTLYALHEGNYANWWVRWLYVVSGLLGCAVIGTGLVLWTVKRRTQHQQRVKKNDTNSFTAHLNAAGLRLVEILNAGTLAGLPLAVAAYFWANRLLPLAMADRARWEVHTMFLVWGLSFVFVSIRPLKRAWLELLCATVAAYALIPVLNALTTDKHLVVTLHHGDWVLAGFDLSMLGLATMFAYIVVKLKRKWQALDVASHGAARTASSVRREAQVDSAANASLNPVAEGAQP